MSTLDPDSQTGDLPGPDQVNGNGVNGNGHGNGALATIESVVHQVPALSWAYGPPQRPEILKAKPNPVELIHAMRRRWPLAIGLGVTLSTIVAGLVWFFVPVQVRGFRAAQSCRQAAGRVGKIQPSRATDEFAIFKRTQVDLIKSNVVMHGTFREKDITQLSMYREHSDDPINWLSNELIIDYPNDAEVLRIAHEGHRSPPR